MQTDLIEDELDKKYEPRPVSNFCKYHRKDTVCRKGRLYRGEFHYIGNSSVAPRKDHKGKGPTLRDKRCK